MKINPTICEDGSGRTVSKLYGSGLQPFVVCGNYLLGLRPRLILSALSALYNLLYHLDLGANSAALAAQR